MGKLLSYDWVSKSLADDSDNRHASNSNNHIWAV
jgi:hypothetical protein